MVENVIADCRENGFKTLRLEVDNGNTAAIQMYAKLGFRKEKESANNSSFYCLTL